MMFKRSKKQIFALLFSVFMCSLPNAVVAANDDVDHSKNLPQYSLVYDAKRDPFKDARDAIALANQTDRNILIEIGGTWCTWCHKIDAFLAQNPLVYQALHNNFVLLKVSVSDENENEKFMAALPPVLGYPHMYVSTGQGKMILSKDTAEFLIDGEYSSNAWLDFINTFSFANNQVNLEKQAQLAKQQAEQP